MVETIDDAIAVARAYAHRFRIVTLDGQVMNAGGSMTGGSLNRSAGILSRANELAKLTASLSGMEQKLADEQAAFEGGKPRKQRARLSIGARRNGASRGAERPRAPFGGTGTYAHDLRKPPSDMDERESRRADMAARIASAEAQRSAAQERYDALMRECGALSGRPPA